MPALFDRQRWAEQALMHNEVLQLSGSIVFHASAVYMVGMAGLQGFLFGRGCRAELGQGRGRGAGGKRLVKSTWAPELAPSVILE